MSNTFKKYFIKHLKERALPVNPDDLGVSEDQEAFNGSFENGSELDKLEGEVNNATPTVEDNAHIVKKANMYSKKITGIILPLLRELDNDLLNGDLSKVAPEIKGISDIRQDLAKLAEALTGETNEAIRQKLKDSEAR